MRALYKNKGKNEIDIINVAISVLDSVPKESKLTRRTTMQISGASPKAKLIEGDLNRWSLNAETQSHTWVICFQKSKQNGNKRAKESLEAETLVVDLTDTPSTSHTSNSKPTERPFKRVFSTIKLRIHNNRLFGFRELLLTATEQRRGDAWR